jgi:hypothetical protein
MIFRMPKSTRFLNGILRAARRGRLAATAPLRRRRGIESLEARHAMASIPFGALPQDTGEFFLGKVAVTPVFLESSGAIDTNLENWSATEIQVTLDRIREGLDWWTDLLASRTDKHQLEFVFDTQYATNPKSTPYEPITRVSDDYELWVDQFLDDIGIASSGSVQSRVRDFNIAQRTRLETDWAFTIFVVDSELDPDDSFAAGGSFNRAFAFAGGLFQVVPSGRPASTYAHETGHMFWALDEYSDGGALWSEQRGYYNAQNLNGLNGNPDPNFQQELSIMSAGITLDQAYQQGISPDETVALIGWRDSDGDGIFDLADVPLRLEGSGRFDATGGQFRFVGNARVQTLPNQNSSGLRNDITINKISRLEYRIDGGGWQTARVVDQYTATLDVSFVVPAFTTLELRAIDDVTGVTSNSLLARGSTAAVVNNGGAYGSAWTDLNGNGLWDSSDLPLQNASVRLVDANGQPITLRRRVEPDDYPNGEITGLQGVTLQTVGDQVDGRVGSFNNGRNSTPPKTFYGYNTVSQLWFQTFTSGARFRANFATPTTVVEIDAIGQDSGGFGRLEAYDAAGKLLNRATTETLQPGTIGKLRVESLQGQIAYVVAYGHVRGVSLDNLRWGAENLTQTDAFGGFRLPALPDGTHRVQLVLNGAQSVPGGATQTITVAGGMVTDPIQFRVINTARYQNPTNRLDVFPDQTVKPQDVLIIINEINRGRGPSLLNDTAAAPPYVDVDGDNVIEPQDALIIINWLNNNGGSGGEGERPLAASTATSPSNVDPVLAQWTLDDYLASLEDQQQQASGPRRRRLI